jgi:MinD-like ATPase involved in chromosome partitioning or flagellar assembly
MSLIVIGAAKGGPGVTTAATALAAVWPRRAIVAECDPSGGDLALRLCSGAAHPLAQDRGMLSLATAVRANATDTALSDHVQTAAGGLEVLVGASTPAQASALDPLWPALGVHMAAAEDCDVLADCGRLTAPSVALQLERAARLLVLVVRATTSGMAHLRPLLLDLAERPVTAPVVVLPVIEPRGAGRAEVDAVVRQLSGRVHPVVVGPLALDPVGAAGLAGEWTRRLDRTPLVESARRVAHELDALLAAQFTAAG